MSLPLVSEIWQYILHLQQYKIISLPERPSDFS